MRNGCVDEFTSRRGYNDESFFIKKDLISSDDYVEYVKKGNELNYNFLNPSGMFYARQVETENNGPSTIGGYFLYDENSLAIETEDDVEELKKDDLVNFRGLYYRVVYITKTPIRNNNEFCIDMSFKYRMRLQR